MPMVARVLTTIQTRNRVLPSCIFSLFGARVLAFSTSSFSSSCPRKCVSSSDIEDEGRSSSELFCVPWENSLATWLATGEVVDISEAVHRIQACLCKFTLRIAA